MENVREKMRRKRSETTDLIQQKLAGRPNCASNVNQFNLTTFICYRETKLPAWATLLFCLSPTLGISEEF